MAKKEARNPLLYIQQPGIKPPEATMQSHYRTPKKENQTESKKVKTHPFSRNYFEHKQDIYEEAEEADVQRAEPSGEFLDDNDQPIDEPAEDQARKKRFRDMDLEERINYFLVTPDHVPAMRAEVKTEDQNYRGKIVDYQDATVYMRVGRRPKLTEIPFDTVTEIRLIGF
ncbi:hypothetical protein GCM10028778_14730 [Barrientosiimonas marina]|uniref:CotO family spore coat protein n=1 Tax=Lentibacillus kimchii TaxID=1542911 RepID=A0ABW2UUJ4_9BACI